MSSRPSPNSRMRTTRPPAWSWTQTASLPRSISSSASPQPAQDLQGARLDAQRARLVHPVQLPVDDANGRPERPQLGGQGEAGRSGADDQDVERVAGGGCHVRAARVARQRRAARPASVTRVRLALAATMTGAHTYDPGLVSAWPVMMPSRVRSATTAARAATAAAVGGEGRPVNDSAEPAAQPAGGGDGQAQRWTGDRQGQADQRERQPWADQLVAPWRQGVDHDRGDPGQPDQRPGDQQAERHPTRLHRAKLRPERGGDGVRVAELGDRRRGRLRLGASLRLVGLEGFQEPVAQLIGDRGPGGWRPGELGGDRRQVVGDRVAAGRVRSGCCRPWAVPEQGGDGGGELLPGGPFLAEGATSGGGERIAAPSAAVDRRPAPRISPARSSRCSAGYTVPVGRSNRPPLPRRSASLIA